MVQAKFHVTEKQFQRTIVELAHLTGWLVHHGRTAMNQRGQWSSPMQGNPGFPDLVLAKPGRVAIAELKSEKGKLTPDQEAWLAALGSALGPGHIFLWTPSCWPQIEATLRNRRGIGVGPPWPCDLRRDQE